MKICCYWTSCHVSFIGCLYLGILGFKSEQYIYMLDFCILYLIYGNPVVCLFSVFASLKYIFFTYCSASTDLLRIELNLDGWKTIDLKIIALFLSFFRCRIFFFLLLRGIVSSGGKNIFRFLLVELVLRLYFLVFS